jgi:hypothetical protein
LKAAQQVLEATNAANVSNSTLVWYRNTHLAPTP